MAPSFLHPPDRGDSAETAAAILEAAEALLTESGPNGLTFRTLAEASARSESTIARWGGLPAVQAALCERHFLDLLAHWPHATNMQLRPHRSSAWRAITGELLALHSHQSSRIHLPLLAIGQELKAPALQDWLQAIRMDLPMVFLALGHRPAGARAMGERAADLCINYLLTHAREFPNHQPQALTDTFNLLLEAVYRSWPT